MSLSTTESPARAPHGAEPGNRASLPGGLRLGPLPSPGSAGSRPGSSTIPGTDPRFSYFRLVPPYEERIPVRSNLQGHVELPFGSIIGLEVPGAVPSWMEVEQAILGLRWRTPLAPITLMIDRHSEDLLFLAARVARLPVRAVLFRGEPLAASLRRQITRPSNLPEDVVEWLALRGIRLTPMTAHLIREIFARAVAYREIVPLLRDIGNPESSARFRCRKKRLPSPGRWLHVARALETAFRIQAEPDRSLLSLAHELGYADHSALSNQLQRVFRMRPGEVRKILGWEWLLDRWLTAETDKGRRPSLRRDPAPRS